MQAGPAALVQLPMPVGAPLVAEVTVLVPPPPLTLTVRTVVAENVAGSVTLPLTVSAHGLVVPEHVPLLLPHPVNANPAPAVAARATAVPGATAVPEE